MIEEAVIAAREVIKEVSQLTERCDGYEGGVRRCAKV